MDNWEIGMSKEDMQFWVMLVLSILALVLGIAALVMAALAL
jgi:hypothetical protein